MNKEYLRLIGIIGGGIAVIMLILFIGISLGKGNEAEKLKIRLITESLEIQKLNATTADDLKRDYLNKCLLARQVYQWSCYRIAPSKVGDLNLNKYYAMTLREYNDMVEQTWDYNRMLSIPMDSWENYILIAKNILESALNERAQHKTGELIAMAGYTRSGFEHALIAYKYRLNINPGHRWYIRDLDTTRTMTDDDIRRIFSTYENVLKFDYAYFLSLAMEYDYRWDWMLTGFHFGTDKTDFWESKGLKEVPNVRLDGRWSSDYYLREYYQAIFEIAQGISQGNLQRISRMEEYVNKLVKYDTAVSKYVMTLKLKTRSEDKFRDLEESYMATRTEFSNYRRINEDLLRQMANLNDLTLDIKSDKSAVSALKQKIKAQYRKLVKK